ncbi:hypothetical protein F0919_05510 [Taibaiella lutea]|uniref:DUF308 domain-containing protein n=1 Tax=Taibaiella lutea TaxID=2608001 RepID=A0A5M6CV95_9BACT|nr:hypothetical protein [Taibaiella lutea]KAA5537129.1 hypothetical protein F0919_05510 [Taibaiella lutea]
MSEHTTESSLETLKEIRSMMERSARFLSLSGWSGIWAGSVGLIGAGIAYFQLKEYEQNLIEGHQRSRNDIQALTLELLPLAIIVFVIALLGGYYFTYRKNKKAGVSIWNSASKKMIVNLGIPFAAGAVFVLALINNGDWQYVSSGCLIFYGLSLINGSKYTVSDIKYLGLLEVVLGCIGLFISPGYGLYLWAFGFGVLHIVYGIIMWRKYEL